MEVAGALTAAIQERRTVSALAVSICHIAKFANDIFPCVASMEDSVTSVRYPGQALGVLQIGLFFTRRYRIYFPFCTRYAFSRMRAYRTAKSDVPNDAQH